MVEPKKLCVTRRGQRRSLLTFLETGALAAVIIPFSGKVDFDLFIYLLQTLKE